MAGEFTIIDGMLRRTVRPSIPPYPKGYIQSVKEYKEESLPEGYSQSVKEYKAEPLPEGLKYYAIQFWPLYVRLSSESKYWQFPIEPLISISGENIIVRRTVAKGGTSSDTRGTVKERWGQADYQITINGLFCSESGDMVYPESDVEKLRYYCESGESLEVKCELFKMFNITHISIEKFDIPFTKGENRQEFSITAYSDSLFELLIDKESDV